jgi:uridylate kinase
LLKLSGESLCEEGSYGIAPKEIELIAKLLKEAKATGIQLAVVVGGGNIIRGARLSEKGINRHTADYMGMLGTLINAIALQDALEKLKVSTRVQTAITTSQVAEPFIRRRCVRHLEKGRIVILAGGCGAPLFTTDTTAALRAKELEAEVILKATKVDGVFTEDPKLNPDAKKYERLSHTDVLTLDLDVMDGTAIALAREHRIPIRVFNIKKEDNLLRVLNGEPIGTLVIN